MKKRLLIILIGICVVALLATPLATVGCGEEEETTTPAKTTTPTTTTPPRPDDYDTRESIVIGAARSVTGPLGFFEATAFGPVYKMWVDEVNAAGGIYVEEYGKSFPVEMLVYDDTSDVSLMTQLVEKLCVEDEVDFLFGPCGTAPLFATAPIANKYETIMLCAEGGATSLIPMLPNMPYVFSVLNFSDHYQMPVMAELFAEWGVESVYAIYIADLHGAEYLASGLAELTKVGIPVVDTVSVPMFGADYAPIIRAAMDSGADAFVAWIYPWMIDPAFEQTLALGYQPKVWLGGPGVNFESFRVTYGDENIEGVIGEGAWNEKSSPAAAEWTQRFIDLYGRELLDWWGHLVYWAALEHFKQSIEAAGTLDSKTVRDVMATSTFDTILGPFSWETQNGGGGLLPRESYAGQLGQWQNGIFEVIDPDDNRTAEPIYPKPPFPAQ